MPKKKKIVVCIEGKTCGKRHSKDVFKCLKQEIKEQGLEDRFKIKKSDCLDSCKYGPIVRVEPEGCVYGSISTENCTEIIKRHAKKRKPSKSLTVLKKS